MGWLSNLLFEPKRPPAHAAPRTSIEVIRLAERGGERVYKHEAVGESFHRDALLAVCRDVGSRPINTAHDFECRALLVREPSNPHDPNAVAVTINGRMVAHLRREDAAAFAPQSIGLSPTAAFDVRCRVRGGWLEDGEQRDFRVRVYYASPLRRED